MHPYLRKTPVKLLVAIDFQNETSKNFIVEAELRVKCENILINALTLCYPCLQGTVVSSLSLMQKVVGSKLTFYKNIANEFTKFSETYLRKTPLK